MVKLRAYAKINLALEVMDKVDGFHKVNNLMVPISIYDELILSKSDKIFVENDQIKDNICIKAAKLFFEEFGIDGGVKIELIKHIPLMAGLAGGSTDAAAVLKGLNQLYELNVSNERLKELAKKLGSDVPFFIDTKVSLCTNRGEVINPLDIDVPRINVLLIKPSIGLSTKDVYNNYKYMNVDKSENIKQIIEALKLNKISLLKSNIFNDLAESAISLSSELKSLYNTIKKEKIDVFISGSGPTMFVINPTNEEIDKIRDIIYDGVFLGLCHTF